MSSYNAYVDVVITNCIVNVYDIAMRNEASPRCYPLESKPLLRTLIL